MQNFIWFLLYYANARWLPHVFVADWSVARVRPQILMWRIHKISINSGGSMGHHVLDWIKKLKLCLKSHRVLDYSILFLSITGQVSCHLISPSNLQKGLLCVPALWIFSVRKYFRMQVLTFQLEMQLMTITMTAGILERNRACLNVAMHEITKRFQTPLGHFGADEISRECPLLSFWCTSDKQVSVWTSLVLLRFLCTHVKSRQV